MICPLKVFEYYYQPDTYAKSMVKRLIFLRKFAVIRRRRKIYGENEERKRERKKIKKEKKKEDRKKERKKIYMEK